MCSLVIDAFFPIRAVIVGAFVPVVRTVLAPIAVAVLVRGRRGIAGHGDLAGGGFARTVRRGGSDRRGTNLDRRHGAVRGYGGNILVRGRPLQSLVGGVLRRDRGGQRFAVSNRNRSARLVQRNAGDKDIPGRDGADVAADVAGHIRVIVVDVRRFVLDAFGLGYLQTIAFILVIAALVQMVEIILKKVSPALYQALGVFLPLITTNCCILGVTILVIQKNYDLLTGVIYAFSTALGFALALIVFAGIREQLSLVNIPKGMRGMSIALVTAGLLAMAFMGFSGVVKI